MKKLVFLVYLLSLTGLVSAQKGQHTLGLTISSSIATQGLGNSPTGEFQMPPISPSAGVNYDWNFGRVLGLSLGTSFRNETFKVSRFCAYCFDGGQMEYVAKTIELPVNITINLNNKETTDVKTYFIAGYTYSYLFSFVAKDILNNIQYDYLNQFGVYRNLHFLNIAIEGRHNIKGKYTVGFSPFVRILVSKPMEGGTSYFGFALKFGRIL